MRASSLALLAALVLTLACSSAESDPDPVPASEARDLMENRNWLDRWPTNENDRLFVYRFTPAMGGGVFQDRTLFVGRFELFTYKLERGVVRITWPDRGVTENVSYEIAPVKGPKPFDLRLTLRGTGLGPKTFYGMRSETGDLEASLRGLLTD